MQENTQPAPQNELPTMPVNSPVPERVNAFKYPEQQKTQMQYNLAAPKINPLILVLLIIIFLLGLAIILWKFVFGSNVDFLNAFRAPPSPTPTTAVVAPTAMPTVDPIASWKTYKNEKWEFEFKYPGTWISQSYIDDSLVAIDPSKLITEKELQVQNIPPGIMSIQVNMENPISTTYCWKELPHYGIMSSKSLGSQNNIQVKFIENYNTDSNLNPFYHGKYKIDYYFCSEDGINVYATLVVNKNEKNLYLPLFDQILSTFKFTGANSITVTPIATESSRL